MFAPDTAAEFSAPRPIAGYRVVVTCFLLAVYAWGLGFYGLSVYVQYLGTGMGRNPAMLSAATTLYFVLGAGAMAGIERLAARFPWRGLAGTGVALMAASACALAWAPNTALLLLAYAGLACGWAACSGTAISQIIGRWFLLRRGLALSLALTGASFGGILVVPLFVLAIDALGPRAGIALVATGLAALMLPLVRFNLVEPRRSASSGAPATSRTATTTGTQHPDNASRAPSTALPPSAVTRTTDRGRLAWLCTLFATGWFAQVAFLSMQIPILAPRVGAVDAAAAVSLTTGAAIAGRLVLGALVDRLDHRLLTAASFLLQLGGMLVLLTGDGRAATFAGCALFGFSVGNVITLPAVFAQHEFDHARYGAVIARIWTVGQLAFAFGPICAGLLLQAAGATWPVLAGCAACQGVAALMCLRTGAHARRDLPQPRMRPS